MKLHTLWLMREEYGPELLFAFDEATIVNKREDWEKGCAAARKRYGLTEADTREVLIDVPYASIVAAFYPRPITGEVV